jgi:hypothetical protein
MLDDGAGGEDQISVALAAVGQERRFSMSPQSDDN